MCNNYVSGSQNDRVYSFLEKEGVAVSHIGSSNSSVLHEQRAREFSPGAGEEIKNRNDSNMASWGNKYYSDLSTSFEENEGMGTIFQSVHSMQVSDASK
jgi:hypothetical protein